MRRALQVLSLSLNLVLVFVLVSKLNGRRVDGAKRGSTIGRVIAAQKQSRKVRAQDSRPQSTNIEASTTASVWSTIESEDYSTYIARLRAVGCPETTIRNIIIADVHNLYEEKRQALNGTREFWQTGSQAEKQERQRQWQELQLEVEESDLIHQLLSTDMDFETRDLWVSQDDAALMFGFLPDDEVFRVLAIGRKYESRFEALDKTFGSIVTRTDAERLNQEYEAARTEFRNALSPANFEEGELRIVSLLSEWVSPQKLSSETIQKLNVSGFELREIYRISQQHDDLFRRMLADATETANSQQAEINEAIESDLRKLLGEQRYLQWVRSRSGMGKFSNFAETHGISSDVILKMHDLVRATEIEQFRVSKDDELAPFEKEAALREVKNLQDAAVRDLLGPALAEEYFRPKKSTKQEASK